MHFADIQNVTLWSLYYCEFYYRKHNVLWSHHNGFVKRFILCNILVAINNFTKEDTLFSHVDAWCVQWFIYIVWYVMLIYCVKDPCTHDSSWYIVHCRLLERFVLYIFIHHHPASCHWNKLFIYNNENDFVSWSS